MAPRFVVAIFITAGLAVGFLVVERKLPYEERHQPLSAAGMQRQHYREAETAHVSDPHVYSARTLDPSGHTPSYTGGDDAASMEEMSVAPGSELSRFHSREEWREAYRAALDQKFYDGQSDLAQTEANYRSIAEHIAAGFKGTDVELELSCSSTICYIDWPYEHREFLNIQLTFRDGWPVEGFERYAYGFRTESGGNRLYLFREGEIVVGP